MQGVVAAMFGGQDNRKYQEDFEQGDALQFIAMGILVVALFVLNIRWLVSGILAVS